MAKKSPHFWPATDRHTMCNSTAEITNAVDRPTASGTTRIQPIHRSSSAAFINIVRPALFFADFCVFSQASRAEKKKNVAPVLKNSCTFPMPMPMPLVCFFASV